MTEYKKLYKQIGDLNNKIKKLEIIVGNKTHIPTYATNGIGTKSSLISYRIYFPKESCFDKKYVGLKFNSNPDPNSNDLDSDEKSNDKNLLPFIKLSKSNVIINYSIQLELDNIPNNSIPCSLALGIKTSNESKIKIIKGTKFIFDLAGSNIFDNKINISNNILYSAEDGEELCVVADFNFSSGFTCVINSKKSIIKLLYV